MPKRLDALHTLLLDNTVLKDWFLPMQKALDKVRYSRQRFSVLSADLFILLGCLRQLQGTKIMREQIQALFDLDESAETVPRCFSTSLSRGVPAIELVKLLISLTAKPRTTSSAWTSEYPAAKKLCKSAVVALPLLAISFRVNIRSYG